MQNSLNKNNIYSANEGRAGIFWERACHCMKASLTSQWFCGLFPLVGWHRWNYVPSCPYTAVKMQNYSSIPSVASPRMLRSGPCATWSKKPWIASRTGPTLGVSAGRYSFFLNILYKVVISRCLWVSNDNKDRFATWFQCPIWCLQHIGCKNRSYTV